jgi:phage terminase large subunit-like protein
MNDDRSRAEILASLPAADRAHVIGTPEDAAALEFDWSWWGRPKQFAPAGDWSNWLILAGRGFGKTRTGAEWVRANMCGDTPLTGGRWRHVALVAETAADARDVMVGDGKEPSNPAAGSGILQIHPKDFVPLYEPSKRRLTWPNGAVATLYNGTEPEQLRGPEHAAAWLDEVAKYQYADDLWAMLQFGLRTGQHPQTCITTTPRPTRLLKEIISDPATVVTRGSTLDNRSNLAPSFLTAIMRRFESTRLGRQEIFGEILEDMEGALWKRSTIDELRVKLADIPPLRRIVVAIDPATTSGEDSDETGIVAVGLGTDGHGYVLDDISGRMTPNEWAREAISLYRARLADRVIGERNNGGDMIENTLRMIDPSVNYRSVWASRGKFVRAEPVAALYDQQRVHHVGGFPQLEDQMCSFTPDMDRATMGSPDRADALCWALTDLLVEVETESRLHFTSFAMSNGPRQPRVYY